MVKMFTQCVTQCSENDILKGCLLFGVMIFRQCKVIKTSWYMNSILAIIKPTIKVAKSLFSRVKIFIFLNENALKTE
jgi:hypothetical protein